MVTRKVFIIALAAAGIGFWSHDAQAQSGARGCADHLRVEVDTQSITAAANSGAAPGQQRLRRLRDDVGQSFRTAAARLCRRAALPRGVFSRFDRLMLQQGSGATEATIYEDAARYGRRTLILQWAFAEAGTETPALFEIGEGLVCWATPRAAACADRGD